MKHSSQLFGVSDDHARMAALLRADAQGASRADRLYYLHIADEYATSANELAQRARRLDLLERGRDHALQRGVITVEVSEGVVTCVTRNGQELDWILLNHDEKGACDVQRR